MLVARVRKVHRGNGGLGFLLNVEMEVHPGITILFGPSGAGKSTLLDCLAGLTEPNDGRIEIDGETLFDSKKKLNQPPQHRRMAYVFQSLALFPHLTVIGNVAYGLPGGAEPERQARIAEILQMFRVEKLRERKPGEISGGEQQRVALARSLVTRPRVLLLDEPLSGLDAELKTSIIDDLRAWNKAHKIPILYVTHSREEVDALGERVIAMERGRMVSQGAPREVLDAPRRRRLAQAAGFENLLSGTVMDLREPDGVMRVRLDGAACEIEVPLGHAAPGDQVRVAIRAGDILLATEPPRALSARNVLVGKIQSLERRGSLVVARIDCGVVFTVHVTPGAERALELAAEKKVWLVLKTHSCHFVEG
ncbi:MAG TPA: molybdenum ABC transporter ATP-binding protein [Candidatus Acidoferrum sp.]|nr:molybdenum ABC transporter ATP-binding protein [Candidatus Acidoferrum sp.]